MNIEFDTNQLLFLISCSGIHILLNVKKIWAIIKVLFKNTRDYRFYANVPIKVQQFIFEKQCSSILIACVLLMPVSKIFYFIVLQKL